MKGAVTVYNSYGDVNEFVCRESNMIVDSAGEGFVDALVAPPTLGVSSIGDTDIIVDSIFDTSNYSIGLMSFGKSEVGYKNNLHKYKKHNLIASASNFEGLLYSDSTYTEVISPHSFDGSSVVARLSSSVDDGGYIEWSTDNRFSDDLRYTNQCPRIFTLDIKPDLNNIQLPASHDPDDPNVPFRAYTTIKIEQVDLAAGANSYVKEFTIGFTNPIDPQFGQIKGELDYVHDEENTNLLYKALGNGWYRVSCVIPSPTEIGEPVANHTFSIKIYPCSNNDIIPGYIKIGSILVSRLSLTAGSVPITYHLPNEDIYSTDSDLEEYPPIFKSVGQDRQIHFVLNRPGTLTNYTEGYNVSASLPEHPNPRDTRLQPVTETEYQSLCEIEIDEGHNLNFYPFTGESFLKTVDYLSDGWTYTTAYESMPLQYDFNFLGGFAPKDARLDKIRLYDENSETAGNEQSFATAKFINVNGYRGMDERGYLRVFASHENPPGTGTVGMAKVTSTAEDAAKGLVNYTVVIPNADRVAANCFGGIFELGLHTIDSGKTREYNGLDISKSIDKDFNSKNSIFSKLFCKKSFTFDITNSPIFQEVFNVTVNWELDFSDN